MPPKVPDARRAATRPTYEPMIPTLVSRPFHRDGWVRAPCPFQALITMEVSRLGREQTETAVVVREILRAGVRLFTYADGREIGQDSALDKFSLNALNFVAEMERELSRTRTREAMRSKARRGHVAGGKVYGYRNVRRGSTATGFPVPARRAKRWAMTCVREMVLRDLYRGEVVYGKTRWQDRDGTKVKVPVPESEWLRSSLARSSVS